MRKILLIILLFGIIVNVNTGCTKQNQIGIEVIEDARELENLVNQYNQRIETEND